MYIVISWWNLHDFLQESGDRESWCQVLQVTKNVVIDSYLTTNCVDVFFRCLVIMYADRGLVVSGKPYISLLINVFWVTWVAHYMISLSSDIIWVFQGTFFEMDQGKICLILPLPAYEKNNSKYPQLLIDTMSDIIFSIFIAKILHSTYRYITNVCPKKSMVCFGKYRRNIFSLAGNIFYFWSLTVWLFGDSFIQSGIPYFSPTLTFSAGVVFDIFLLDVIHGLVLPIIILVKWRPPQQHQTPNTFYVRKVDILEPRRSWSGSSVHRCPAKGKGKSKISEPKHIKNTFLLKPYDNRQILRIDQSLGIGPPKAGPSSMPDIVC